ncbi:putative type VI secretion system, effector vgrS domain protein [Burkholderia pseudomallei]|nr:putative type VI secretion system, effector vgrS domain protein [Burkholderia pseudomallei]
MAAVVDDHERFVPAVMLEVVVEAFLLHPARHEIEMALVVLADEAALAVAAAVPHAEIAAAERGGAQHALDDVGNRLLVQIDVRRLVQR